MAGGWTQDGAVNEQIEVSTREAIERMRLQRPAEGRPSRETCADCDEPIPQARRKAVPGVQLCLDCQQASDKAWKPQAGINRRGSKDSQLK